VKWAGSRDKIFSPSGRGRTFFLTSLFIELIWPCAGHLSVMALLTSTISCRKPIIVLYWPAMRTQPPLLALLFSSLGLVAQNTQSSSSSSSSDNPQTRQTAESTSPSMGERPSQAANGTGLQELFRHEARHWQGLDLDPGQADPQS
jgi:hypothetical protein